MHLNPGQVGLQILGDLDLFGLQGAPHQRCGFLHQPIEVEPHLVRLRVPHAFDETLADIARLQSGPMYRFHPIHDHRFEPVLEQ